MSVSLEAVEEAFDIIDIGRTDGAPEMSDDEARQAGVSSAAPRARGAVHMVLVERGDLAS